MESSIKFNLASYNVEPHSKSFWNQKDILKLYLTHIPMPELRKFINNFYKR